MNSNAHFEYVRHKYLIKLISWGAVYLSFYATNTIIDIQAQVQDVSVTTTYSCDDEQLYSSYAF